GEGMALHRIVGFALTSRDGGLHCRASVAQIGLAAALAVGMTCAAVSTAQAGDYDDPSGTSFSSKVLKAIGLPDPDHPEYEINYSERSPLVVPPNRNLPAPIATDKPPAPNWPQDPDLKKHQAAKAEKSIVRPNGDPVMDEGQPLQPDRLIPPGSRSSAASSSPGIEPKQGKGILTFDWFRKEEYGTFTGEPPRASLTDPPPGYQTPSPDQPYGIPPDRKPGKASTRNDLQEAPK
ncbi:MAG: hypothetical protein ACLQF4_16075, partial [Xanthobacteraceae bacterium]